MDSPDIVMTVSHQSEVETTTVIGSGFEPTGMGRLISPANKQSSWWDYFMAYSNSKLVANCKTCQQDVRLGISQSTSKVQQHMMTKHRQLVLDNSVDKKRKSLELDNPDRDEQHVAKSSQITGHFAKTQSQNFRNSYLKWIVSTYKPLSTCESEEFRQMIQSVNPKVDCISNMM